MTTGEALQHSIAHWLENEQALSLDDVSIYAPSCALCQLFIDKGCEGCPVFIATGEGECRDSPYSAAHRAYLVWHSFTPRFPVHPFLHEWQCREAFHLAAKAERLFLESLLDE
jgi:hypothetical protein